MSALLSREGDRIYREPGVQGAFFWGSLSLGIGPPQILQREGDGVGGMWGTPHPCLLSSEVDPTLGPLSQSGLRPSSQGPQLEQEWQGWCGGGGSVSRARARACPTLPSGTFSFSALVGSRV